MTALLLDLWPYLAGAAAVLAGAFGLYRKGRSDEAIRHEA